MVDIDARSLLLKHTTVDDFVISKRVYAIPKLMTSNVIDAVKILLWEA